MKFPSILIIKKVLKPYINIQARSYKSLKIDDFSFDKLKKLNINKLKLIKKSYFQSLSKILEKNKINIIHKNYNAKLNPGF